MVDIFENLIGAVAALIVLTLLFLGIGFAFATARYGYKIAAAFFGV